MWIPAWGLSDWGLSDWGLVCGVHGVHSVGVVWWGGEVVEEYR